MCTTNSCWPINASVSLSSLSLFLTHSFLTCLTHFQPQSSCLSYSLPHSFPHSPCLIHSSDLTHSLPASRSRASLTLLHLLLPLSLTLPYSFLPHCLPHLIHTHSPVSLPHSLPVTLTLLPLVLFSFPHSLPCFTHSLASLTPLFTPLPHSFPCLTHSLTHSLPCNTLPHSSHLIILSVNDVKLSPLYHDTTWKLLSYSNSAFAHTVNSAGCYRTIIQWLQDGIRRASHSRIASLHIRRILTNVEIDNQNITIVNVNAPNELDQHIVSFRGIYAVISKYSYY